MCYFLKQIYMYKLLLLLCALVYSPLLFAQGTPELSGTQLFKQRVKNCVDVDLTNWQHPTRQVLVAADVKLKALKLCNNNIYPIFFVDFKYDPQGLTTNYFAPLYQKMKTANGGYAYSFVVLTDELVINISYSKGGAEKIEFEHYRTKTP